MRTHTTGLPGRFAGERRHDILFRIIGGPWWFDVRFRQILGIPHRHHGGTDSAVECGQELCQRCAAGLAATADTFRINLRTGDQIVDAADPVPRSERPKFAPSRMTTAGVSCSPVPPPSINDSPGRLPGYSMRSPCPKGSYASTT